MADWDSTVVVHYGNQGGHTEAIKSRYELWLIPAKLVLSGRRKIIKLAVGGKLASFLKQAYQNRGNLFPLRRFLQTISDNTMRHPTSKWRSLKPLRT